MEKSNIFCQSGSDKSGCSFTPSGCADICGERSQSSGSESLPEEQMDESSLLSTWKPQTWVKISLILSQSIPCQILPQIPL